jgi:hypothetical protein
MLPFSGFGPFDRTERKALLCAAGVSILFIFVFALARPRVRVKRTLTTEITVPPPPTTPYKTYESELPSKDLLEPFRVRPEQFEQIDFRNFSFGPYSSPDGKKIDLRLFHSVLRLPKGSGWFSLKDVYYRDITGDGLEEAIVWLTHVQCYEGSCSGRTDLFYIYTMRNGMLRPIWEYETGSYAEGCGLRSVTFWEKQINLMLFGDCPKPVMDQSGPANFRAGGFTHILLEFDGRSFTQKSSEFYTTPVTDLHSYEPAININ